MADKLENNENSQNYVELTENQIFEKIKEDLNPIQENLAEKKITLNEAKSELKKINERIQWTKLEKKDKKEIWKAFDKLIKNIDENTLKDEVIEIIKLLNNLTKKDLASLKQNIKWSNYEQNPESSIEAQIGREESSENLATTVDDASQDSNIIARTVGSRMKKLMS